MSKTSEAAPSNVSEKNKKSPTEIKIKTIPTVVKFLIGIPHLIQLVKRKRKEIDPLKKLKKTHVGRMMNDKSKKRLIKKEDHQLLKKRLWLALRYNQKRMQPKRNEQENLL